MSKHKAQRAVSVGLISGGIAAMSVAFITLVGSCKYFTFGLLGSLGLAIGAGLVIFGIIFFPFLISHKVNQKKFDKLIVIEREVNSAKALIKQCESKIKTINEQIDICNRMIGDRSNQHMNRLTNEE